MNSYNKMMVVVGKTAEIMVSPNLHAICNSTDFTSMHILVPPYTACNKYLIFSPKWTISKCQTAKGQLSYTIINMTDINWEL